MKFMPHDYQTRAIQRIVNQDRVGLLLDMGLGKTVITLTAVCVACCIMFEYATRRIMKKSSRINSRATAIFWRS